MLGQCKTGGGLTPVCMCQGTASHSARCVRRPVWTVLFLFGEIMHQEEHPSSFTRGSSCSEALQKQARVYMCQLGVIPY